MIKSDSQLRSDVQEELRWDPRVGRIEVGVAARDGVVTLSGEVDSFSRKYSAAKAAERVAGVKAIADELTIKLPSAFVRSDTEVAHSVVESLRWAIDVPDSVKARVENGWVSLEGMVEWQYQRASAERAIRHLTGVKGVSNLITIKPRASAPDVREKIQSAIRRRAEEDSKNISIEAVDGKITLRGVVRSWAERLDAENAAWAASGVSMVDDQLRVQL
jgi:osmotically-inducible protein OsmY